MIFVKESMVPFLSGLMTLSGAYALHFLTCALEIRGSPELGYTDESFNNMGVQDLCGMTLGFL